MNFRNPAVVVGHPGHELLAYGFLAQYRPMTHVLTDGSGIGNASRVDASARILRNLGVSMGELFGVLVDTDLYDAVLQRRSDVFVDIRDRLVSSFRKHDIDFVLADAAEGFNPTHDVCRYIVDAAAAIVNIPAYELKLTHWVLGATEEHDERCMHLELSDEMFASKLATANEQVALTNEIRAAIDALGEEHFRTECFRPAAPPRLDRDDKPYYEQVGEMRAARGDFPHVLRFDEHVRPIAQALFGVE